MALGGTSRDIRLLVLRQGMLPALTGLVTGLAASIGFHHPLQSQLILGVVHRPSYLCGDVHRPDRGGAVGLPDSGPPPDACWSGCE
jgi:ABC-type antimicrobial peptide transport system permease subunit